MRLPFNRGGRQRLRGRRARTVIATVAALTVGLTAGAAYAYFTGTGSGIGAASAGSLSPVTLLTTTATVTNQLYPGGSGDLLVTIDNQNSFALSLTAVSQDGSVGVSGGNGCTSSNAAVSVAASISALPITLPAGTHTIAIPDGAVMGSASNSGCQGATFNIPVTLTVQTQ